jgi:hypothetical protein
MRGRTRQLAGAVVVLAHGLGVWLIATHAPAEVRIARPEPIVARLLFALEPSIPEQAAEPRQPERPVLTPPATPPRDGSVAPTAYALAAGSGRTVALPSPPVEPDAPAGIEGRVLRARCAGSYPSTAGELHPTVPPALIVRTDASGRPLDVRIVRTSGDPLADNAISNCVLAKGAFTPGEPAASGDRWLRLEWPPATD